MSPLLQQLHAVCIITAAGSSSRFADSDEKKEFIRYEGKALLAWSLKACRDSGVIRSVLVTHPPGRMEEASEAAGSMKQHIPVSFTAGGGTRQESVRLGLEFLAASALQPDYVLIHDGARPWVTPRCIRDVLERASEIGGALPVVPLADAVKHISSSGKVIGHLDRSATVGAQTPQGFEFPGILEAHRLAARRDKCYIDDTEVYTDYGGSVAAVPGDLENRKVTYSSDIPPKRSST